MADTYTQLITQIVFAVKGRAALISSKNRDELQKYMCGILSNKKSKPLAIYCNPDHVHILIGMNPSVSVSEIAKDVKANSSRFINEKMWVKAKFQWQEGYGAFTYSRSQVNIVVNYILNQEEHHKKRTFKEEYLMMLQEHEITFKKEYLFEFHD